jgi:uncharacterized Zn-binding protein involved in type VI secretion
MGFSVGVHPPKTPITEGSGGVAKNTIPNVCKMPGPPAPFVPTPLPNIGKSELSPKDYSKTVKMEGKTVAIRGATFESIGDVASKGTGGGLISANTQGPTKFITPGSLTVKIEGKSVHLKGESMLNNCGPSGSPPNTGATMMGADNPESKEKPCPPHHKIKVIEKDRAQEKAAADNVVNEKQQAVDDAKKNLADAEKAKAVPYKLRPKGTSSATLTQNVDIMKGRLAAAEAELKTAKQKPKSLEAEQKVADDEGGGRNIKVTCEACKKELAEVDVLTKDNKAKEVKQSGGGFDPEEFTKMSDALALPEVVAVLGAVTPEVAIVSPDSEQICKDLEADHPDLKDHTQKH